jgi:DNA polymerase I
LKEKMANDKPLVLVDGSSYLFRAYHALPKLTTAAGFPTGALKGVIGMLRKLAKDFPGSPIAVVFDAKGKTFRNEIYPAYKAHRPPMPDDLRPQVQPILDIIRAMGLPLLVVDGVEADDVIGVLAQQASERSRETVVSTSDKDLAQLVSPHVTLVNTMTNTRLDRDGVIEKLGVAPERVVDLLALVGDPIDNIPGVPKVGQKTAAKWLNEYGSLETIMARADEIQGKVGENLRAALPMLPVSKALATIRCDLPLELGLDDLVPAPPDRAALREQFREYEFNAWADELADGEAETARERAATPRAPHETILERAALDTWLTKLRDSELISIDTETDSLSYMSARLVGFSFAVAPDDAAYLPVGHDYPGAPPQLPLADVLAALKPILEDDGRSKVGQNLKYDKNVLARHGIELRGIRFDTMLESYVLDSVATRHNMDDLAARYLDVQTIRFEDVAGKGARQLTFNQVPLAKASEYAAEDADIVLKLHRVLWPRLEQTPALQHVFEDIEMPLVNVLSRIECTGALVDGELLARQSVELAARMHELAARAWEMAGEQFNLDSTRQLQAIFYDKLGLPVLRKTPGGSPSTAEPVLQELALDYELPRVILEYRSLAKLKSTYTDKLPLQIKAPTGRIHTCYHQAVAATGRLSSSDPNLQNIPIRTPEGRRIRQAFIAPAGKRLVAADYSQIELRIMAHLSADDGLLSAFSRNLDVHRATAAEVFGCPLEEVTPEQRRSAKAINFGLIYGMSAFGLARQLGLSRGVAQQYIERYFTRYPGVRAYMDRIRDQARAHGYVETVFGRRLYLPDINARNPQLRQGAERTAINAPMQGSAADIIKRAMIDVDRWLAEGTLDARMIMQVHDELVLEVAEADVDEVVAGVRARMERAADLTLPLEVDVGIGCNWDEAH